MPKVYPIEDHVLPKPYRDHVLVCRGGARRVHLADDGWGEPLCGAYLEPQVQVPAGTTTEPVDLCSTCARLARERASEESP